MLYFTCWKSEWVRSVKEKFFFNRQKNVLNYISGWCVYNMFKNQIDRFIWRIKAKFKRWNIVQKAKKWHFHRLQKIFRSIWKLLTHITRKNRKYFCFQEYLNYITRFLHFTCWIPERIRSLWQINIWEKLSF